MAICARTSCWRLSPPSGGELLDSASSELQAQMKDLFLLSRGRWYLEDLRSEGRDV
uniref:Uncharacterized protein n=1 Tax=Arundo donax TaxID=35708 RepID=A0A0A9BST6_ARUDO